MRLKEDALPDTLNTTNINNKTSGLLFNLTNGKRLNSLVKASAYKLVEVFSSSENKTSGLLRNRHKRNEGNSSGSSSSSLLDRIISVAKATPTLVRPPPLDIDHSHKFYDEDYTDLINFLYYLRYNRKVSQERHNASIFATNSSLANQTHLFDKNGTTFTSHHPPNHHDPSHISYEIGQVPAALIQLLIIALVMLFVLLLCKCNKLMAFCQHQKTPEELEDERYHDTMRFKEYLCYICLRCKHKHRKRRNRKFIRKKFIGKNDSGAMSRASRSYSLSQKLTRTGGVRKRKASIIFRRRSAICQPANRNPSLTSANSYRNKSRRRTTKVRMSNARLSMGGAVIDESNEPGFDNENKNIDEGKQKMIANKHGIINEDDYDDDDYDNINNEEDENCVF
jgi:hypothetical protein